MRLRDLYKIAKDDKQSMELRYQIVRYMVIRRKIITMQRGRLRK